MRARAARQSKFPPLSLPPPWRIEQVTRDGISWSNPGLRAIVIWSVEPHDGALWHHISMSVRQRTPTWKEMVKVKEQLLGQETWAYQIMPPRSKWISEHEFVLHIWAPVDGEPRLPDFGRLGHI